MNGTRAAANAADLAARRAGVTVSELHRPQEMHEACRVLDRIWRPALGSPLIPPELLRVFAHSGSYVAGVHREGRMVGFCLGFLASAGLHSHIAGVDDGLRGRNVGFAVKQHQRAWALARGITTITWTFDPMISRNAYFNLAKLGAEPSEYLPDFYGSMQDEVNAGTETDRLMVRWELTGPRAVASATGTPPPPPVTAGAAGGRTVVGLEAGPDGRPVVGDRDGDTVLVRVPAEAEELRRTAPCLAREWRRALREVLGGLMARGHAVTGFTRDGRYVIERRQENPT
ncbi:GNAT family N-acetyltransferase [Streptomyces sp. NPDC056045]|uniref:GNAT family N-acetyltransferase n=1 Tax=Streptomyces sp. NPDC056045 TaxID=3345691 RepID=UPI0035D8120F